MCQRKSLESVQFSQLYESNQLFSSLYFCFHIYSVLYSWQKGAMCCDFLWEAFSLTVQSCIWFKIFNRQTGRGAERDMRRKAMENEQSVVCGVRWKAERPREKEKWSQPGVCQQHVTGVADHYSTRLYIQHLPFTPYLSLRLKCVEWFGKVFFKRKGLFCLFAPFQIKIKNRCCYQSFTGRAFVRLLSSCRLPVW